MDNNNNSNTNTTENKPKKQHEQILFRKISKKFYDVKFVKRWSFLSVVISIVLVVVCAVNGQDIRLKFDLHNNANGYIQHVAKPVKVKDFSDNQGEYIKDYNLIRITRDDIEYSGEEINTQLKNALGVKSAEYCDSYNANTFAVRYSGNAFDGLNKITEPISIYNYSGEVDIDRIKIKRFYDDDAFIKVEYDPKTDKYSSEILYESNSENGTYYTYFDVKNTNPFCIIKTNYDFNCSNYSLVYTIIENRLKNTKFNGAVVSKFNSEKIVSFNADKELLPNIDERFFKNYNRNISKHFSIKSSAYKEKLDKKLNSSEIIEDSFEVIYNPKKSDIFNVYDYYGNVSRTKSKSIGYAPKGVHKSGFDVSKNGFLFTPFKLNDNSSALSFAMAEIVSNYYNYKTIPSFDNLDSQAVLNEITLFGTSSEKIVKSDKLDKEYSVRVLNNNNIESLIVNQSNYDLTNIPITSGKITKTSTGLSNVIKQIDKGKTVVAYLTNGKKSTAVVVYEVDKSAIDSNKYILRVYDPNFPASKISLIKDEEIKNINTNMYIEVELRPHIYRNSYGDRIIKYDMYYEYGRTMSYYWGNSGKLKNGLLYKGGEILFRLPNDLSKSQDITFIGG